MLELLHGTDAERLFAAQRLAQVVYADAEMTGVLQQNAHAASAEVRMAALQALEHIGTKDA